MKKHIVSILFCTFTALADGPSLDPQIAGVRDDGSESGIISTENIGGDLVPVPFLSNYICQENTTGGSSSYQNGTIVDNSDGSNTGVNFTCTTNYASVWFAFYGRTLGVRFRNSCTPFTLTVDGGDAIRVKSPESYLILEGRPLGGYHELRVVTHRDLGPGVHFGKIIFGPGQSGLVTGLLLERNAGYALPSKSHSASSSVSSSFAVATNATYIAPYSPTLSASQPFLYISKIIYCNTNAIPVTLTWDVSGQVCLQHILQTNEVFQLDFPTPISPSLYYQTASTNGLIATFIGGQW